jgi:Na+-driven multidrug efflux pump
MIDNLIFYSFQLVNKLIATYFVHFEKQLTDEETKTIVNIIMTYSDIIIVILIPIAMLISVGAGIKFSFYYGRKK